MSPDVFQNGSKGSNPSKQSMHCKIVSNVTTVGAYTAFAQARQPFSCGSGFAEAVIGTSIPDLGQCHFAQVSHGEIAPGTGKDRAVDPDPRIDPPVVAGSRIPHFLPDPVKLPNDIKVVLDGLTPRVASHA
jgi:hypothetical protein